MSYLVLARKKRPQTFEDVIGQRPITQTLQNAISQNRVAHAFLFTGPRGVGKTSTARILAKTLNCEKGPQINPCNQCAICREVSEGNSIDVIEIDGASNRGIDEVRELRENVRYTPAKSRYKVYIIDEVHMLTLPAFNALLKTLEEPPPHVLFIFATTEPHKIPATILSRCQRYDFRRIPLSEITQHLRRIVDEEGVEISQRGLSTIARESEGSMRDAQGLLDRLISYGGNKIQDGEITEVLGLVDQKILLDTIEAIADHNPGRCLEIAEQIYQFGYDIRHFCQELLQYLRNLILLKVSSHPEPFLELPGEEIGALKRQAEKFHFDQLNQLFSLLLKGEEEVAQSTFARTMLEMTLIRMAMLRPLLPIDEIIRKLEELEKVHSPSGKMETIGVLPSRKVLPPTPEREAPPPIPRVETVTPPEDKEDLEDLSERRALDETPQAGKEEVWRELIDFVRARNPVLGSFLALGCLIRLSGERIEIGFEKDSFHYERMTERENRNHLEQLCRDFLKKEAKVIISSLEGENKPRGTIASGRRENSRMEEGESSEKGVGKHPLIQEALRLFDGKIVQG
jgi:DNA polymerase-3 subunit gamma/tau